MFSFLTQELLFAILFTTDSIGFQCHLWSGNIFLAINFIAFDLIILSDLYPNPNNLSLVDCLMCLNISLIALKILSSCFSGWILLNLQPTSFPINFCYFISYSIFINFYCQLIVIKIQANSISCKIILCLRVFSFKLIRYFC